MAWIPEETIDRVVAELADLREAVQIQTQAVAMLSDVLKVQGQWLQKTYEMVSKKPERDTLGDMLRTLIAADKHHAEVMQQILTAVREK